MEDSLTDASPASGDSSNGVAPRSFSLAQITQAYKLLDERATIPSQGLPYVDCPEEVLVIVFDESDDLPRRVLDELWARRYLLVVQKEDDGEVFERALLLLDLAEHQPEERDPRSPTVRFWEQRKASETQPLENGALAEPVCLVPNFRAATPGTLADLLDWDDPDENGEEEARAPSDETIDGLPQAPKGFPAFQKALVPALRALVAHASGERYVPEPLFVMRDPLRFHGVPEAQEMAFVNWLVVTDFIFILVVGPKLILMREEVYQLLAAQDALTPIVEVPSPAIPAPPSATLERPLTEFRGKRFSPDVLAAGIAALIEAADEEAVVRGAEALLASALTACGEDPIRAKKLLGKLIKLEFIHRVGNKMVRILRAGITFAIERRRALELALHVVESDEACAPMEDVTDAEATADEPGAEAVCEEPSTVREDVTDEAASDEHGREDASNAPETVVYQEPAPTEPDAPDPVPEPPLVDLPSTTAADPEADKTKIVLDDASREVLGSYLAAHPDVNAEDLLSELVVQHLGPMIEKLRTALELSYQILWQRRSKDIRWRGKPAVFSPVRLLACYPPHLNEDEAEPQLDWMLMHGWIRWVHPRRDPNTGRRPQAYIVLLRDP